MITPELSGSLARLTCRGIILVMMVGCSFDANRLRAPAAHDAASTPFRVQDSRTEAWDEGGRYSGLAPEASQPGDPPQSDALVLGDANHGFDADRDLPQGEDSRHDTTTGLSEDEDGRAGSQDAGTTADVDATVDGENPGNDAAATGSDDDAQAPFDASLDTARAAETGGNTADGGLTVGDAARDAGRPDTGPPNVIRERQLPAGHTQPWVLTAGPDNSLWIAGHTSGRILKYSIADDAFTGFQALPNGTTIEGIAWGPDNNLWFTEYSADKIARMTISGQVTEYPVTRGSGPDALVVGLDGKLWFTEMSGNRIGSISVEGAVSEYPVNILNSQPARLAVTADGNIWFTQYSSGRIGRLVPSSPTPTVSWLTASAFSAPSGIAAGPDGNLWFYLTSTNRIGRMTTAGVFDDFAIPTPNSAGGRGNITLGPDSNLWFTEYAANKIGRITPSGAVTEFPIPTRSSGPAFIVAGPDGQLWFTQADANKLASIAP